VKKDKKKKKVKLEPKKQDPDGEESLVLSEILRNKMKNAEVDSANLSIEIDNPKVNATHIPEKLQSLIDEEKAVIPVENPKKRKMGANLKQQVFEYPAVEAQAELAAM